MKNCAYIHHERCWLLRPLIKYIMCVSAVPHRRKGDARGHERKHPVRMARSYYPNGSGNSFVRDLIASAKTLRASEYKEESQQLRKSRIPGMDDTKWL